MKKMNVLAVILVVLVVGSAYAGLISHYEFQGNLLNSVFGGGDGTGIGGAEAVCYDPNDTPYPLTYPTICRADMTGNKWIHVGYPGVLYNPETTQKLTMAMWIRTDYPYYRQLFGRGYQWRMYIQDGAPAFGALGAQGEQFILLGTKIVADNKWHHVAATYDGATGEAALYVDGQQDVSKIQTDPLVTMVSSSRCGIGGVATSATTANFIFDGYMDDVRVYDEILTATQIEELYQFTNEPFFCLSPPAMDFTGNCQVGIEDLVIFLQGWLENGLQE